MYLHQQKVPVPSPKQQRGPGLCTGLQPPTISIGSREITLLSGSWNRNDYFNAQRNTLFYGELNNQGPSCTILLDVKKLEDCSASKSTYCVQSSPNDEGKSPMQHLRWL